MKEEEVQADWDQNDPTAPDYVKNRPFYKEIVWEDIHPSILGYHLTDSAGEGDAKVIIAGNEYPVSKLARDGSLDDQVYSVVTTDGKYKMTVDQITMAVTYEPEVVWQCFCPNPTYNTIPAEYLPTDICVLTSSTPGSEKKFRITVDDSGTLSAVEVN